MNNSSNISCIIVDAVILSILSIKQVRHYRIYNVCERKNNKDKIRNIQIKLFSTHTLDKLSYDNPIKIPTMKFISSIRNHLAIDHDYLTVRVVKNGIYLIVTCILNGDIKINNDYNYNAYLSDNISGLKMKLYYPKIYSVLSKKYGYTWDQYYRSIIRFPWLEQYFIFPNKYIDAVPSLLHYFAGIDEICLFDIVYKAHVTLYDNVMCTSKLHMRYKMKNKFIKYSIEVRLIFNACYHFFFFLVLLDAILC